MSPDFSFEQYHSNESKQDILHHIYDCTGYSTRPSHGQTKAYLEEHQKLHEISQTPPCHPAVLSQAVLELKIKRHRRRQRKIDYGILLKMFLRNQSPEFLKNNLHFQQDTNS